MENEFQRNRKPNPNAVENECLIHKNVELACLLLGRDLDAEWAKFNDWSKTTSSHRTGDSVYTYKSAALYKYLPWDSSSRSTG